MFDPQALQKAVNTALSTTVVPDGHKGALLTTVDASGAKIIVAHKLNDQWQVVGTIDHPWADKSTTINAGIQLHGTW